MNCPHCDTETVVFAVPPDLRDHAPDGASAASVCPHCLTVAPASDADPADDPAFERVHESFPAGDGGVAFALLLGTLPSIALNKTAARACRERAEREGVDTALAFDRLVEAVHAADVVPEFDLERRVRQLDSLLDGAA
ncbi:DUF6276 family protein [Halobaculum litoreum]|uniref:DUF6276 family protein n=1 Tax=Halobaculum litoreum TaxID=3031998 RepID=UPI0024C446D4|nr:DUF6276 family protein [Halobaculum sp. DT92]